VRDQKPKRILFVSPYYPVDVSKSIHGAFQRMRMWLDAIQSVGAELDILLYPRAGAVAGPEAESATAQELSKLWGIRSNVVLCEREPQSHRDGLLASYIDAYVRPALGLWRQAEFSPYRGKRQREALAQCLARSPDIVFFHRLHAAIPAASLSIGSARIFVDLDDVEHRKFIRELARPPRWPRWRLKPLLYLQLLPLWWGERAAIIRSDRAFVCSETDRQYLQRTMRVRNVEVIPNAVRWINDVPLTTGLNVLFIGTYGYGPNNVAAEYLIQEVWPHLAKMCPKARLLIAGPGHEAIPSYRNSPVGVEFLGFVSDLDALYRRTRVVCCPIQTGGGTRIKILEAASYGIPVVSSPLGAEGIDLMPDTEIVLRNSATDLAKACAELLSDHSRAHRIGAAARERVRVLYTHDAIIPRIKAILTGDSS